MPLLCYYMNARTVSVVLYFGLFTISACLRSSDGNEGLFSVVCRPCRVKGVRGMKLLERTGGAYCIFYFVVPSGVNGGAI